MVALAGQPGSCGSYRQNSVHHWSPVGWNPTSSSEETTPNLWYLLQPVGACHSEANLISPARGHTVHAVCEGVHHNLGTMSSEICCILTPNPEALRYTTNEGTLVTMGKNFRRPGRRRGNVMEKVVWKCDRRSGGCRLREMIIRVFDKTCWGGD